MENMERQHLHFGTAVTSQENHRPRQPLNKLELTPNQQDYVRSIIENTLTICSGVAGTGKSILAVKTAISQLEQGNFEQIIITRSLVNVGREIGSLPGSLKERSEPYFAHIHEYLKMFLDKKYEKYIKDEIIRIIPTEMIRGHTYDRAIIICDEAQNLNPTQIKTVISRMGKKSKCIIEGDPRQQDAYKQVNGLAFCVEHFEHPAIPKVGVVKLGYEDIKRNEDIKHILQIFEENGA